MKYLIYWLAFLPFISFAQTYKLMPLTTGTNTSIRGMSAVSDDVAWVSGSNGYIGKTIDGGKTWQWTQPAGYEKLDFRDIEAFDQQKAIVVNAGSPAYVLLTIDGGKTWTEHYKNLDSAIFLDGMDFWDAKNGIIFGDPILHKMQLLRTKDGGQSWNDISANLTFDMAIGEAGFAASGTTIKALPGGRTWIATGGAVANIYFSDDYAYTWKRFQCPIIQGESSTGTFAMAFYDKNKGVVVGGNYLKDKENSNNVLLTADGGKTWKKPVIPVSGYRSGVTYLNAKVLLATGSSGTDISQDGGLKWYNISDQGFNVVQKSKRGNLVLLAGNKGCIFKVVSP
ncbi:MAG: YCF48-related protein [Candidatus Pedobacter colombiensis]|uniref:YCF48-related protein n=1 Tax=Candidatus Pedobacter colombiensis TaxID=3121371 RepID=A0AAJ5W6P8_9SPHI|nr:YCF48-related protein [Pedobacter sp.]WEK18130.1 MAG: YCF48-related protein [Pedobacter sp.]